MPSPADRDAGLLRIGTLTKWVAALAAALVGVFAGLAAAAHPGRAAHSGGTQTPSSTSPTQTPSSTSTDDQSNSTQDPSNSTEDPSTSTQDPSATDPGLQPPAQAPAPAPSNPSAGGPVSGGS